MSTAAATNRCTDVAAFLRLLVDATFEIRALDCPERSGGSFLTTFAGYFTDPSKAASEIEALEKRKPVGIYVTLNPVNPALLARSANRISKAKDTTKDSEILRRRWLMVDIDPTRAGGISSSDSEMQSALELAEVMRSSLDTDGWPAALACMSGNGAYLLYRVDLPNDKQSTDLIKRVLQGLAERFNNNTCHVDQATFNAARIIKACGTTARKGDDVRGIEDVEDRPHRQSWFIPPAEPIAVVSCELLESVAVPIEDKKLSELPKEPKANGQSYDAGLTPWDDFNQRGWPWEQIVESKGWKRHSETEFTRPEKGSGVSGGIIHASNGEEIFHCFTDQAAPLEPGKNYSRFELYKQLHHGGDGTAAGREVARMGFGEQKERPKPNNANGNGRHSNEDEQVIHQPIPKPVQCRIKGRLSSGFWNLLHQADGRATVQQEVDGAIRVDTVDAKLICIPGQSKQFVLAPITHRELMSQQYQRRYLVERVLVEHQSGICGGPSKTLKTSLMLDLLYSLASGLKFLGHFNCLKADCLFLSGESGRERIQMLGRAIARAKRIEGDDLPLRIDFTLPQVANIEHMIELERVLEQRLLKESPQVCVIDPTYLTMPADINMASSVEVGAVLRGISQMGEDTGCTMIICHHVSKGAARAKAGKDEPMELEDLSQSGFAEWARQWILLSRRDPYVQGSGAHRLYLNIGGSMGHSGLYAADIDEGQLDDRFQGTRWEVSIRSAVDARAQSKQEREKKKLEQEFSRDADDCRRLLQAMNQFPNGETKSELKDLAGLSTERAARALRTLLAEGKAEPCTIKKNKRDEPAFRPVNR